LPDLWEKTGGAVALITCVVALFTTSCAGASHGRGASGEPAEPLLGETRTPLVVERQFGDDANGFYLFTPRRQAWTSIVVFVHGHGGAGEITPKYHRPWLRHLAVRGSAVVYPRYELFPGGRQAAQHIVRAVRYAISRLGGARRPAPIVGIGYSRGARLVVDWAALAPKRARPRAILSVFPASAEEASPDLSTIPHGTHIEILTGDRDEVVGVYGAVDLIKALAAVGFRRRDVSFRILESTPGFEVTHLSVLSSSPRARTLFWDPADRLVQRTARG
jgi:predicted esterase